MSTFSTSLTAMAVGADWAQASLLNQLVTAIRKRHHMLYSTYVGAPALVVAGDDVQSATWIRSLQSWVETNYTSFCRPAQTGTANQPEFATSAFPLYSEAGAVTFAGDAGLASSATPSNWWRKNAASGTVGPMVAGDAIGEWIWQDLAAALGAMNIVRDTIGPALVNLPLSWLESAPKDLWFVDYRSSDPVLWLEWSFTGYYFDSALQKTWRNNCTSYFQEGGRNMVDMYVSANMPPLPYDGAPAEDSVWMYSAASITNYGTDQAFLMYAYTKKGYGACLGSCGKCLEYTPGLLFDGTITRKMFLNVKAEYNLEMACAEGTPKNILPAYQFSEFSGSGHYYIPPPESRGGGDAPLATLQNGWNAIFSKSMSGGSTAQIVRNITDSFQSTFSDWTGSCPSSISEGAQARNYIRGWQSNEAEAYLFIPDY